MNAAGAADKAGGDRAATGPVGEGREVARGLRIAAVARAAGFFGRAGPPIACGPAYGTMQPSPPPEAPP